MGLGVNLGQVNFSKGVLSPELFARVDIASANAGLKRGENVILLKRGGLMNRMGTRFVYELPGDGRLFPFEYSIDQTYALAMTQGQMIPMAYGGAILEEELEIDFITNANPAQVTVQYHGYSDGDEWYAFNVEGMVEMNGRILPVTVIDDHNFTVPVDSTSWGAFTGSGGGVARTAPPSAPPSPPAVPAPVAPPPNPNVGGEYYGPGAEGGGGGGGGEFRTGHDIFEH